MQRLLLVLALLGVSAGAADFNVPPSGVAGQGLVISTQGSGNSELLIFGPGTAIRKKISAGQNVTISGNELRKAGTYTIVNDNTTRQVFLAPGDPKKISFIARPWRVPVSTPQAVIGVAFVFDENQNLTLKPVPVNFALQNNGAASFAKTVPAREGVAYVQTASGAREGAATFVVSINGDEVRRIVQQVASDPCSIRMQARRAGDHVELVTDPIKDCSGNPVPDGTIVTFSEFTADGGRSTVDSRIKRGVARATLPAIDGARVQVASGVVLGNEIRLSGGER